LIAPNFTSRNVRSGIFYGFLIYSVLIIHSGIF